MTQQTTSVPAGARLARTPDDAEVTRIPMGRARTTAESDRGRRLRAGAGGLSAGVGLIVIWLCRATLEGDIYVSAMGAAGMATAPWLNLALMLVAAAAILVSTAVPTTRPRHRVLALWPLGSTFVTTGAFFAFAAAVPCSDGCPVPLTPGSTLQDLLHVTAAVLGFVGAVVAILQVWSSSRSIVVRAVSAATMVFVAVAALAGAFASLAELGGGAGGWLEFAATTAALAWMAGYGITLSRAPRLRE